ncbi:hypothetical protein HD553DRAFT_312778 [Filobasidium floriforme]|uniref:uncharacterized protein n=1 Tax=Filobasidium floriforme TaxID=5210 RepID=UPI001E8E3751|nr:uncharacterized protein HD553DRAFT_312778 [Filobasidium floriforme]KAH8083611.1 hypothetical protein HD553DRAFT_312778 [Filobasidium floriforme]
MAESILQWLEQAGGLYDAEAMGIKDYSDVGMGWGAVALKDLEEDTALFTIPDKILLSACNSGLRNLVAEEDWDVLEEHGGWASLMLSMMWEEAQGEASRWSGYIKALPNTFQTPMFWTDEQIQELKGTDIVDKIGRQSAEDTYNQKIKPVLQKYPDVFKRNASLSVQPFSLEHFHIQGSRILSRSFSVPSSRAGRKKNGRQEAGAGDTSMQTDGDVSMQTDEGEKTLDLGDQTLETVNDENEDEPEEEEDEEDDEDAEEEVMVPVADMLNAAYERDNARLFHEDDCLKMVTTKAIAKGDQIFNTYGSPSNSYLLRKYGHVDVYPLPEETLSKLPEELRIWPNGNEGDEVEITGEVVLDAAVQVWAAGSKTAEEQEKYKAELGERVDWWLEAGEEDTFVLTYPPDEIPEAVIGFARLLIDHEAWEKARDKDKVPKPKIEQTATGVKVIEVLLESIKLRRTQYFQSLSDDLAALSSHDKDSQGLYSYMARVVRTGEARVLAVDETILMEQKSELEKKLATGGGKRKAETAPSQKGKKPKTRLKVA